MFVIAFQGMGLLRLQIPRGIIQTNVILWLGHHGFVSYAGVFIYELVCM